MPRPVQRGDDWYHCEVVVINEMGLHARPASQFVELSNRFRCDVRVHRVQKGTEPVDGKSILEILSLSAEAGTLLKLETRGSDARDAIDALAELVSSGFKETPADSGADH